MPQEKTSILLEVMLNPHPSSPTPTHLSKFRVSLIQNQSTLRVSYRLEGDLKALQLPKESKAPRQRDELWKSTCMELFLATSSGDSAYIELNFSPSGDWAVYGFDFYRSLRDFPIADMHPQIQILVTPDELQLEASLPIEPLSRIMDLDAPLLAGPAAILAQRQHPLSYWAIRHSGTQPDFHDPRAYLPISFNPD